MKFNILISTSQLNSLDGNVFGAGSVDGVRHLATVMEKCGIEGDIYDLPNGSRNSYTASPFSLNNGFALTIDELNLMKIPELFQNQKFYIQVKELFDIYHARFKHSRKVDYTMKRTMSDWILKHCFKMFNETQFLHRLEQFQKFEAAASYWLEDYAVYEVYRELFPNDLRFKATKKSRESIQKIKLEYKERIQYYKYIQFLCFEQRQQLHNDLKKQGKGLIINLPFGVELYSADVYFHPDVFDTSLQVGCSPEPYNGFPEQAWGIAAYKEKSEGLARYLSEKMKWLSLLGDGLFIDHLVGWCGQYVLPMELPTGDVGPYGGFLTENVAQRESNLKWFLDIVFAAGLSVKGEVVGDYERVQVTRKLIDKYIQKKRDICAMTIPRWEEKDGELMPLSDYKNTTLMMVETHDTSTLLQYLMNQKGDRKDFETLQRIESFANRVLGLPWTKKDVPLQQGELSDAVCQELIRRLVQGSRSKEVVFTFPSLVSLLRSEERTSSAKNNINFQPGTSGALDNEWNNWCFFSPEVETLADVSEFLSKVGKRSYAKFDYFHCSTEGDGNNHLKVLTSKIGNREIVFKEKDAGWKIWSDYSFCPKNKIIAEILIFNSTESEAWQLIDVSESIDLEKPDRIYGFKDLNNEQKCYFRSAAELKEKKLFVKLDVGESHHFLLYDATDNS